MEGPTQVPPLVPIGPVVRRGVRGHSNLCSTTDGTMTSRKKSRRRMFPVVDCPSVSDLIVYYVTRVVCVPIYSDTDLAWFNTPVFGQWVQDNNLPSAYLGLMRGSLKSAWGCRIPAEMCIELPPKEEEKIVRWLASWRDDTFRREYTMALRDHPEFLRN